MKKRKKSISLGTFGKPTEINSENLVKYLNEAKDMLENVPESARFIPNIWSEKILSKFFDQTMFPLEPDVRSLLMKNLTAEITRLSEEGFTPEQIAEKIDPDKLMPGFVQMMDRKFGHLGITHGLKVIKPGGHGILGTTS